MSSRFLNHTRTCHESAKENTNNHNLHHPPDSQAHAVFLLSKHISYIYICPYSISLFPPLTSTTIINTHLWGVQHTSATTWTVGRPKGLHGRKGL